MRSGIPVLQIVPPPVVPFDVEGLQGLEPIFSVRACDAGGVGVIDGLIEKADFVDVDAVEGDRGTKRHKLMG